MLEVALLPCDPGATCASIEELYASDVLLEDGATELPEAIWRDGAGAAFDGRREVELGASGAGEHRVLWTLCAPDGESGWRRARGIAGREELLRGDAQRFTIAPDPAALKRALDMLER